jgi:hypothetical protein
MDAKSIQQILDEQRKQSEIFSQSLHKINTTIANKTRAQDPEWLEKVSANNRALAQDPEWLAKNAEFNRNKAQDESYIQGLKQRTKSQWASEEGRKKKLKGIRNTSRKPEVIAKKSESSKKAHQRPEVKEKRKQSYKRLSKPVKTPIGVFPSLGETARTYNKAVGTVQYWLKTKPTEYYYITKEEYEQLKGLQ